MKEAILKGYDSTLVHVGRAKTAETVKGSVITRGSGAGRGEQVEHRGFLEQWNCSLWHDNGEYMSFALVRPHGMYTTRRGHIVNYGIWVIRTYQCRIIDVNKCTTLVWDVDRRGDWEREQEIYENSWYLSLNFSVN